jgi:hypothetical protein
MGVTAANHPGVKLTGQIEIVGVSSLAAHQRVIFLAPDRLSDAVVLRRSTWSSGVILHGKPSKAPVLPII